MWLFFKINFNILFKHCFFFLNNHSRNIARRSTCLNLNRKKLLHFLFPGNVSLKKKKNYESHKQNFKITRQKVGINILQSFRFLCSCHVRDLNRLQKVLISRFLTLTSSPSTTSSSLFLKIPTRVEVSVLLRHGAYVFIDF